MKVYCSLQTTARQLENDLKQLFLPEGAVGKNISVNCIKNFNKWVIHEQRPQYTCHTLTSTSLQNEGLTPSCGTKKNYQLNDGGVTQNTMSNRIFQHMIWNVGSLTSCRCEVADFLSLNSFDLSVFSSSIEYHKMSKGYLAKPVKHTGSFNPGTALRNNSYKKRDAPANLNKTLFFGVKKSQK